ncbi:hypothetical protein CspeluHIS016_0405640 [Cutaneotrichosporon spelunceum]|uniref:Uncharacterized protein n=1 Tax=Cutaneotrichosporon spelunceum TaxID=1672016 RepID=A0AAD3TWF7_9TREE|nr:hypothetical protein CspeluHIS016_0405640 [Cutaneotrichosporon spelunceum]
MATKDSQALIPFTPFKPMVLNSGASWSSAVPKKSPLDALRETLTTFETTLNGKMDTLVQDNAALRAAHAESLAENERLRASNAELAASVRALGASLADSRAETSARVLYGLRNAEHAAREQRVLLRDLAERLERVELEGGGFEGFPAIGGWGPREAIEEAK